MARTQDRVSFVLLLVLLTWFGWLVAQTDAQVGPRGLEVTNLGRQWQIPWSAIGGLDLDREVVVVLRSGRRVRVLGAGGSLAGVLLRSPRQQHIIELLESHRASAADGEPDGVRRTWRLHLLPVLATTTLLLVLALLRS